MRRGYGDETWALAYARDGAALEHVAALLLAEHVGIEYEGHRARAFALALAGRSAEALEELNTGWTAEWPSPAAYAVDVARIHYLARKPSKALTALQLDLRTTDRAELDDVVTLVLDCVRLDRRLWRRGLALALASSSGTARAKVPFRVLRAWAGSSREVPRVPAQPATPGS